MLYKKLLYTKVAWLWENHCVYACARACVCVCVCVCKLYSIYIFC